MINIKQVNEAINKKWPELKLELVKGFGYFWVDSNDENISLKLNNLYTTSIPVSSINQLTIEKWVDSVEFVLKDGYQGNVYLRESIV